MVDQQQTPEQKDPKTPAEWFNWVQDFTDSLTIRRAFMILVAGIMASIVALFYENRALLFQGAVETAFQAEKPTTNWEISEETQRQFKALVQSSPLIKFMMITEVDLQKNRRTPRFWYLDDEREDFIRAKVNTMLPQAVFDYDAKNTQQMVAILQNEFVCNKYSDTVYQRIFPDLGKRMPVVCRAAIPPFYGRFVGMLTVGLETTPTKEELDSLHIEMSRISVEIYLRDVLKKPPPKP